MIMTTTKVMITAMTTISVDTMPPKISFISVESMAAKGIQFAELDVGGGFPNQPRSVGGSARG
jgi:hypothetical protein